MPTPAPKIAPSPLAGPANAITARHTHDVLRSAEKKTLDGQLKQAQTDRGGKMEHPEYHKIETLFERDKATFVVDQTKLKSPVIATISEWDVTEKIDGTNIRVMLSSDGEVTFGGRTDAAQIPGDLVQYLVRTFTAARMKEVLWIGEAPTSVVLYGEGYGPGIQKGGGLYRTDKSFILFDVLVDSQWWLDRNAVEDIAAKLGIDTVPYLGRMTLSEIVKLVKTPFASKLGHAMSEGVVARPIETLFDKRGKRLIIKLKTKDFVAGRR